MEDMMKRVKKKNVTAQLGTFVSITEFCGEHRTVCEIIVQKRPPVLGLRFARLLK